MIMGKDEYMALIEELTLESLEAGAECLDEVVSYVKTNCDYDVDEYIVEEIGELYKMELNFNPVFCF